LTAWKGGGVPGPDPAAIFNVNDAIFYLVCWAAYGIIKLEFGG